MPQSLEDFHYARTLWMIVCGRGLHANLLLLSEKYSGIVAYTADVDDVDDIPGEIFMMKAGVK